MHISAAEKEIPREFSQKRQGHHALVAIIRSCPNLDCNILRSNAKLTKLKPSLCSPCSSAYWLKYAVFIVQKLGGASRVDTTLRPRAQCHSLNTSSTMAIFVLIRHCDTCYYWCQKVSCQPNRIQNNGNTYDMGKKNRNAKTLGRCPNFEEKFQFALRWFCGPYFDGSSCCRSEGVDMHTRKCDAYQYLQPHLDTQPQITYYFKSCVSCRTQRLRLSFVSAREQETQVQLSYPKLRILFPVNEYIKYDFHVVKI